MRFSSLGLSIACIAFSSAAWSAPEDEPASGAPPAAMPAAPSTPPAAPAAPSKADPASDPPTPSEPSKPPSDGDAVPSPKPLTGPLMGPLPPEASSLPPLPSAGPQLYDAPPPPPPPPAKRRAEWGAQFRVQAAPMSSDAASNAGMGGIGFSLRPRPSTYFALDFGLDFLGGRDFNGDRRSESAFSINPMLFLNPRNKVQIYLFAGLGLGGAEVRRDGYTTHYSYVGADAGAGVEFRFWQRFAFSGDVLGFVRDRSDLDGSPEYFDPATRRYTDSSAGALLRLGGTYYW